MPIINYTEKPPSSYLEKEGIFTAEITAGKIGLKKVKEVTVDCLTLTFTNDEGEKINDDLPYTESLAWKQASLMRACGMHKNLTEGQEIETDENTFIGCKLSIKVASKAGTRGDGKVFYYIKEYLPLESKPAKPGGPVRPVRIPTPENATSDPLA